MNERTEAGKEKTEQKITVLWEGMEIDQEDMKQEIDAVQKRGKATQKELKIQYQRQEGKLLAVLDWDHLGS